MSIEDEVERLEGKRKNIRFADLVRVCQEHFGCERIRGSHHIFKMPWAGNPRINLQTNRGAAKPYQVDQVIDALQRLREREVQAEAERLASEAQKER